MFPRFINYNFIKIKPKRSFVSFFSGSHRGNLEINKSAEEILRLCNGFHSIDDIVTILSEKYNENRSLVSQYVNEITAPFIATKLIIDQKDLDNRSIVRGSEKCFLPDTIIWEITEFCPLNCKHCYLGEKSGRIITREEINRVINIILKCGVTTVQLTGGEALTHPDLNYIINQLVNEKLTVTVATSGIVLNNDTLQILSSLKRVGGSVQVSIDGPKEYHNEIRGCSYAYDRSMKFIKNIVDNGISCTVATCLVDQDEKDIADVTKELKRLGVRMQTVALISLQGNAKQNELLQGYTHTRVKELIINLNNRFCSENFEVREYSDSEEKNCGAGYNLMRIKPNLDITPCPMMNFKVGNLNENSIENIMSKLGYVFYDLCSPNEHKCGECYRKEICGRCTASGLDNKDGVKICYWYETEKNKFTAKMRGI